MNGVTKQDGMSTLAAAINAADEWIVLDHREVEGGWIALIRLGAIVITGNNAEISVDAFTSPEDAQTILERSVNTAVGMGDFVKDRGTYEPGTANPQDIAEVRAGIEAMRQRQQAMAAVLERLQGNGGLPEVFGQPVPAGALPQASTGTDDDWRPGMYV